MKLSKILSLILALLLVFGLCACDEGERTPTNDYKAPDFSSSISIPELPELEIPDIPEIEIEESTPEPEPEPEPEQYVEYVYVSRTGYCYHSISYCSNMKNPRCMTRQEAIEMGRSPCSNCY